MIKLDSNVTNLEDVLYQSPVKNVLDFIKNVNLCDRL